MSDAEIKYLRDNEGTIYGEGAASLAEKIRDALKAVPGEGSAPKDPKLCAEAIHKVLRDASEAIGQRPDIETFMRTTGEEGRRMYHVSWESGPYDWAIQTSFVVMNETGRLCEPYYGFDLQLYDVE